MNWNSAIARLASLMRPYQCTARRAHALAGWCAPELSPVASPSGKPAADLPRRTMFARQHALEHPDQPAIIMANSGETVTFAEHEARCNATAHLLRAAGLQCGDHFAGCMENQRRLR